MLECCLLTYNHTTIQRWVLFIFKRCSTTTCHAKNGPGNLILKQESINYSVAPNLNTRERIVCGMFSNTHTVYTIYAVLKHTTLTFYVDATIGRRVSGLRGCNSIQVELDERKEDVAVFFFLSQEPR